METDSRSQTGTVGLLQVQRHHPTRRDEERRCDEELREGLFEGENTNIGTRYLYLDYRGRWRRTCAVADNPGDHLLRLHQMQEPQATARDAFGVDQRRSA